MLEIPIFWDKKPTSEAWITIPRWASENIKGTRILLSLWRQNTPHILGLLYGISWCVSKLPYFQVRLLSKVAWNVKWDMITLSLGFVHIGILFMFWSIFMLLIHWKVHDCRIELLESFTISITLCNYETHSMWKMYKSEQNHSILRNFGHFCNLPNLHFLLYWWKEVSDSNDIFWALFLDPWASF